MSPIIILLKKLQKQHGGKNLKTKANHKSQTIEKKVNLNMVKGNYKGEKNICTK